MQNIEKLKEKIKFEQARKSARDENKRAKLEERKLKQELFRLKHSKLLGAIQGSGVAMQKTAIAIPKIARGIQESAGRIAPMINIEQARQEQDKLMNRKKKR